MKKSELIETKEITKALVKKNQFSVIYSSLIFMIKRIQVPHTINPKNGTVFGNIINPENGTIFGLEAYYGIHNDVPLIEQFEDFPEVGKFLSLLENIAPSIILTAISHPPDGEHLRKDYIWFWGTIILEKTQLVTAINIIKKILYALLTIIRLEWIHEDLGN